MPKEKTWLILAVAALALINAAAALVYLPLGPNESPAVEFTIERGGGSVKAARLLAEEGLIRSRRIFIAYLVLTGQDKNLKAGTYRLSKGLSIVEIAGMFSRGQALSDDLTVTIPEGLNRWEIDRRLAEQGLIETGEFFKESEGLEGYLFPDSYRIKPQTPETKPESPTSKSDFQVVQSNSRSNVKSQDFESDNEKIKATELIEKMQDNFQVKAGKLLAGLREAEKKQTIVIASMLEKEVRTPEDMALVAGIIYKRLAAGMFLQIDAAVAYGACLRQIQNSKIKNQNLGKNPENEALYPGGCDVTQVNLVKWIGANDPYNTYKQLGLPPEPIANPGERALQAALNPQESDYWYYLSARDDGRTIFSKTAVEHLANRRKYLRD